MSKKGRKFKQTRAPLIEDSKATLSLPAAIVQHMQQLMNNKTVQNF